MPKKSQKPKAQRKPKASRQAKAAPDQQAPATPPPPAAGAPANPPPAPKSGDGLTPRERRFVLEYLVDLNATRAAIRAGYSPHTARQIGSENLSKPDIRAMVDAVLEERTRAAEVKVDDVLRGLLRIANADLARVVDENDRPLPIHEIPEDVRFAMTGWEVEELFEGRGEDREHVGRLHKFKFGNKNEALRDLGRYLKMFTDVTEERSGLSDEERIARIAAILEAARARKASGGGGGAPPAGEAPAA